MEKFVIDLWILWLEQMGEVRVNWPFYVLYSILFPIILVFGFTSLGSGLSDGRSLLYIISGSIVMSLTGDGIVGMALKLAEMKRDSTLLYYASLPINRFAFVLALVLSRFVLTIPGMISPLIFGTFLYKFEIQMNCWLFLLIPLISLICSIFGLFIGVVFENSSLIKLITNAIMIMVLLVAPIFKPYESLPLPLQWMSLLVPLSYAAAALRDTMTGNIGIIFYYNLAVLLLSTGAALALLNHFWHRRLSKN